MVSKLSGVQSGFWHLSGLLKGEKKKKWFFIIIPSICNTMTERRTILVIGLILCFIKHLKAKLLNGGTWDKPKRLTRSPNTTSAVPSSVWFVEVEIMGYLYFAATTGRLKWLFVFPPSKQLNQREQISCFSIFFHSLLTYQTCSVCCSSFASFSTSLVSFKDASNSSAVHAACFSLRGSAALRRRLYNLTATLAGFCKRTLLSQEHVPFGVN